jgi:hypothetical protein
MKFRFPIVVAIFLIQLGAVAFGQVPQITPIPPPVPHPTSVPVVVSIEGDKITVQNGTHAGGKVTQHEADEQKHKKAANLRTYTVDRWTVITINGHKSQLSDLKKDMAVTVVAGTDPNVAYSISAKVDRSIMLPVH